MLDLRLIRHQPELLDESRRRRGKEPVSAQILQLDETHRQLLTQLQELQTSRNQIAKQFGQAKQRGEDTQALGEQAEQIKEKMTGLEKESLAAQQALYTLLAGLENILAEDVPEGKDDSDNQEIRRWGQIPEFPYTPLAHYDIGEALGLMDFERASKMSGARFVVLYGQLARLERAVGAFMLDVHTREFGYEEVSPPLLVQEKTMFGTGQLPKFYEDQFQTTDNRWLIPTSEVVLTNLVAEEILNEAQLPMRFTAFTQSFRAEAGSAGRDTRGMIRQHQFSKVELVSITTPEQSQAEHERMANAAEEILKRLNLPYRVVVQCAGDTGFSSQKTYDLEVWLPSQNTYREISSCSICGDFQGRRMNTRYRSHGTGSDSKPVTQFVHTLNGSGLAVGRTIVAILENYQQADGSVIIPQILVPYMGGIEKIEKKQ